MDASLQQKLQNLQLTNNNKLHVISDESGSSNLNDINKLNNDKESLKNVSNDKKIIKNRCHKCNVKTGLIPYGCRCGGSFCAIHRYSDIHNCTFDFKKEARELLEKQNPKIIADKITKI